MEMNFCRRCGLELVIKNTGAYSCSNGHTIFVNSIPAVSVFFITDDNQILLSIRGIEPFKGCLDSFGGFIEDSETAEQALVRELHEELGLTTDDYSQPAFLSTEISVYPYANESRPILSLFFWSQLKQGATPIPADDVASAILIPLANVDLDQTGRPSVRNALEKLQKLRL